MSFFSDKPFIIAEVGTAHSGSITKAKELIDAAIYAKADCVKFQIVYAKEILHPNTGFVKLPGGNIPLYERFCALELSTSFFCDCAAYCKERGILFSASPFGTQSLLELIALNPYAIKIASPELNHLPLLNFLNDYFKTHTNCTLPVILSSGVSLLGDIEKALFALDAVKQKALLHCVTSYPAPEEDYNLAILQAYKSLFGVTVGVSDHSLNPILVPVLSLAFGAKIIEKHICLSKKDGGLDDPVALEPNDFLAMTKAVHAFDGACKEDIIKEMQNQFTKEKVKAVIGTGKKVLAPSEKQNYGRTNRSLHFMHDMQKGQKICANDISVLRTEKVLTPGIAPEWLDTVLGATLAKNCLAGEGVTFEHFLSR